MMRKQQMVILFIAAFCLFFIGCVTAQESTPQAPQATRVRNMTITGEIAKGANAYIIRGKVPAEIFTILNPNPPVLDEYVKTGKVVDMEVRIVSGDNIEIKMLNGKEYSQGAQ